MILYHFLLPHCSHEAIESIAQDEIIDLTESTTTSIYYDKFVEFFAKFCFLWADQSTTKNSILFLHLLYERTTKIMLTNEGI